MKVRNMLMVGYERFLEKRHLFVKGFLFFILLFSVIIGAGYRAIDVEENFAINGGFEFYVEMASHFWTEPGGYNFEEGLKAMKNPDCYIFTRHPKVPAVGSFENEKGWEFILSLIFKEGTKGIKNLAMTVIRYQVMLDLFVIVLLFFAGRAIIGPIGGSFTAILYALFKPSIRMVSWVSYYYWAIPFSALSIFLWTVVYRPEKKPYSLKLLSFLFFLYGAIIGLATSIRLGFLFLPIFISPFIVFRERAFKRSIVLILAMLIGHGILLIPQVLITHKYYGKYTLSVRGKWHHVVSGFGAYPNPFGIRDAGDRTAVDWGVRRGGPELNQVGIEVYDRFMKKEALRLIKERPDIFLENFRTNLFSALAMTPKDATRYVGGPVFFRIMENDRRYNYSYDPKIVRFAYLFPWFVFASIFILFFFRRQGFVLCITVIAQGLYLLGILCIYFPPGDNHATVYFPIYVLLLGSALGTLVKGALGIFEGGIRSWINKDGVKSWPTMVRECFCKDWDRRYSPEGIEISNPRIKLQIKGWKWTAATVGIVIILCMLLFTYITVIRRGTVVDGKTSHVINNILGPETNGGFEAWNSGESFPPDGWWFTGDKDAKIQCVTKDEDILSGKYSAGIQTGKIENSCLGFNITSDKLYELLGKTIIVEGYVKSDNKVPDKVYISICNGIDIRRYPKAYYKNRGDWEKLVIEYKVPHNIKHMPILLNVDCETDAPVYFDSFKISIKT